MVTPECASSNDLSPGGAAHSFVDVEQFDGTFPEPTRKSAVPMPAATTPAPATMSGAIGLRGSGGAAD
jgi:hypothetical protein